jgi:hypothetical protein
MPSLRRTAPGRSNKLWIIAVILIITIPVLAVVQDLSDGPEPDAIDPVVVPQGTWEMAERYAPVWRFSNGERTFPTPVEYFLERSALVDYAGTVVKERPTGEDLEKAGTPSFLDCMGDEVVIERYEQDRPQIAPTVYARVAEAGGRVILQYWLFYVFNQGTYNSHEGDWEMVQVTINSKGTGPEYLALSAHHGGYLKEWDSTEVVNGTHPVVLVAAGSHANYPPGSGQRVTGDHADGLGEEWRPDDYALVPLGIGADGKEPSWLLFSGGWGEPAGGWGGQLGREGPPGPMFREGGRMWEGLRWWS